jgi:hypothetical protein
MRVQVSKQGDTFVVDPVDLSGSPKIGRGTTLVEALGNFLIAYQKELGLEFEIDPTAQAAEDQRRMDALNQR